VLERLTRPASGRRGRINGVIAGVMLVLGIGVALLRTSPSAQAAEIARVLPSGAVAWMDAHDPGSRIFNRYEWGGLHRGASAPAADLHGWAR